MIDSDKAIDSATPDAATMGNPTEVHSFVANGIRAAHGMRATPIAPPISLATYDGWQSFELMPPVYRTRRDARLSFHAWSIIIALLSIVTVASVASTWVNEKETHRRNESLTKIAQPLRVMKRRTDILLVENARKEEWIQWVESARPDDSMIQVLGAVAVATHPPSQNEPVDAVQVQSIEIKLPLEYQPDAPAAPSWAIPRVSMTAVAKHPGSITKLNDRLENVSRLKDVRVNAPVGQWERALVKIDATPLTPRILP